jgi:FMN-dependent NADH-azoreductase
VEQAGIERAQEYMTEYFSAAKSFIDERITDSSFNASLHAFADYVVGRKI